MVTIMQWVISRASKLKDHKIGRSPYVYETKSGDFSRELFKAHPKTIYILRNDFRTVVLRRWLLFILASRLNWTLSNPEITMICHFYASRCPLVLNWGADSVFPFKALHLFCNIIGHCTKTLIKYTTTAYLGKVLFLAGFGSQWTD